MSFSNRTQESTSVSIPPEVPTGVINGSNVTYTLSVTPTGSILLLRNGQVQRPTYDYTITGTTITYITPLAVGEEHYVFFL